VAEAAAHAAAMAQAIKASGVPGRAQVFDANEIWIPG